MKKPILLLLSIGLSISTCLAQTFQTQILNKEAFKAAASLLQDYDGDGDLDIIISRAQANGIYWLENDSTQQFPAQAIITDSLPYYIADIDSADIDKDGDQDYVVCFTDNSDGAGELAWFQRQADGSYTKHIILSGKDAIMADLADFDNNGWKDVAVVGRASRENTLRIYFNNGDANLSFNEVIIADDCSDAIDAEDIDGDGDIDIAVSGVGLVGNPNTPDSGSRLLLNDSTGNFSLGAWLISVTGGNAALWDNIEIIDFDQNGSKDIIGLRSQATSELMFFDGSDNFSMNFLATEFEETAGDFAIFDIDGNGFLDIVRQGFATDDQVAVFYQDSSFSFRRVYIDRNWDNCCQPVAQFSIGDIDGDGDIDLAFAEQGNVDEDVSWYENINGQLYRHQIYGELYGIRKVKLLDFDKDDDLDIFATISSDIFDDVEDEVILYENLDGENFLNWRLSDDMDYANDLEFADLDQDGSMDFVVSARNANNIVWLKNNGFPANWEQDTLFSNADEPSGIAVGHLNTDEYPDVVFCSQNNGMLYALINDSIQDFTPLTLDANVSEPTEVELGDIDNDGDIDVVLAADDENNSVVIYTNEGGLNFSKEIIHTMDKAQDLELVYWNSDSLLDIFVAFDASDVGILGFISNGSAYDVDTFEVGNDRLLSLKVVDMDGDNELDIISGHNKGNAVLATAYLSLIQNRVIGNSIPLNDNIRDEITSIDIGDVNGDGQLDIVYADFDNRNLVLISLDSLGMATSIPDELVSLVEVKSYPNPVQDRLKIEIETQLSLTVEELRIFNLEGQKLFAAESTRFGQEMEIDLSALAEGIYILQILTDIGSLSEKIEVKRN
ncbi:MAG: T9SS type A sorting domain-containing protein [Bacteroidota bacterium]